jgi:hypothetical protein
MSPFSFVSRLWARRLPLALFLGALVSTCTAAHAQVIYDDTFSNDDSTSGSNVNGRTPSPTDTGGATWLIEDGTNTVGTSGDNFSGLGTGNPNFNSLPLSGSSLADDMTYTLSMSFSLTDPDGSGWFAFGFESNNFGDAFDQGDGWMLDTGVNASHALTLFATGTSNGKDAGPASFASGVMSIQLTTDASGAGTVDFFAGPTSGSLSYLGSESLLATDVQAITGVAYFGFRSPDGTISEFSLTESAAPEPSTWAMLLASAGLLAFVARRRLA